MTLEAATKLAHIVACDHDRPVLVYLSTLNCHGACSSVYGISFYPLPFTQTIETINPRRKA